MPKPFIQLVNGAVEVFDMYTEYPLPVISCMGCDKTLYVNMYLKYYCEKVAKSQGYEHIHKDTFDGKGNGIIYQKMKTFIIMDVCESSYANILAYLMSNLIVYDVSKGLNNLLNVVDCIAKILPIIPERCRRTDKPTLLIRGRLNDYIDSNQLNGVEFDAIRDKLEPYFKIDVIVTNDISLVCEMIEQYLTGSPLETIPPEVMASMYCLKSVVASVRLEEMFKNRDYSKITNLDGTRKLTNDEVNVLKKGQPLYYMECSDYIVEKDYAMLKKGCDDYNWGWFISAYAAERGCLDVIKWAVEQGYNIDGSVCNNLHYCDDGLVIHEWLDKNDLCCCNGFEYDC